MVYKDLSRKDLLQEISRLQNIIEFSELQNIDYSYIQALYEFNPLMYFTIDSDFNVLSVNKLGAEQLGYKIIELIGQPVLSVFHPEDKAKVESQLVDCLENPNITKNWEYRKLKKTGEVIWVKENVTAINAENGNTTICIYCENITGVKKSEQTITENLIKLEKKSKYESIIREITVSVHNSLKLQEVFENAADSMMKNVSNIEMLAIYRLKGKNAILQCQKGLPNWFINKASTIKDPNGLTWQTVKEGKLRYVSDVTYDSLIDQAGIDLGTKSYVSVPFKYKDKVIGVINIHSLKKNAFDEDEIKLLENIALQIESGVNNARQAERLETSRRNTRKKNKQLSKKNKYEKIINEVSQVVHKSVNLENVLNNAVGAVKDKIEIIDHISIFLIENDTAVLKAYRGHPDWFIEKIKTIIKPKGLTWKTIIDKKPLHCNDVDQDLFMGPAGREVGAKSYASMPIFSSNTVVGCITIHSKVKNAFDQDEINLLEKIEKQIEIAINNARYAEVLLESEQKYKALFDKSPVGVLMFNNNLEITSCNERMSQIINTPLDLILQMNFTGMEDNNFKLMMENVLEGEHLQNFEFEVSTVNGPVWLSLTANPLLDKSKNITGGIAVVADITEAIKSKDVFLRTQKLESLGLLAGGLAHDFNNLLTGILGYVSLAKMNMGKDDKNYTRLDEAEKISFMARDLTQKLLTFSKGGAPLKSVVNTLSDIIRDATDFAVIGSGVKCKFDIEDDLKPVQVDEVQISQVINNLIINAQQSMPEGGVILVKAYNDHLNAGNSKEYEPGNYVVIEIIDQGEGIPEKYLKKIFDPYFTTKSKGSGLGLTTAYSIVKNHNGFIDVETKPGLGSKFKICLPLTKELPDKEKLKIHSSRVYSGGGKILVMDDEEIVRKMLEDMLKTLGFDTDIASNGYETLEMYKNAYGTENAYEVVIMDLTIPGSLGGKDTLKLLKEFDSNVNAIVSSGYSDDPVIANYREYGFKNIISKPYKVEELRRVLSILFIGGS